MPDRSDSSLESLVRATLRDEAATTPISVPLAAVEARVRARAGERRRRRILTGLGTIAAGLIVVVTASLALQGEGPFSAAASPAPTASASPANTVLPSIDAPAGTTILDVHDLPTQATQTGPIAVGALAEVGAYTFTVACRGDGPLSLTTSGVVEPPLEPIPCDGTIATRDLNVLSGDGFTVFVTRPLGASWHLVATAVTAEATPAVRQHLATIPGGIPDPHQAIIVRQAPDDRLDVIAVDELGDEHTIATIPRSALPAGKVLYDQTDVSELGRLAVPISTELTDAAGLIAIVDLYDPSASAFVVDGATQLDARSMGWSPDGLLAFVGPAGRPYLADPARQSWTNGPFAPGMALPGVLWNDQIVWSADGTAMLARGLDGTGGSELGVVNRRDGVFNTPPTPVYQMSGRGRLVGDDGSTLSYLCPAATPMLGKGCSIMRGSGRRTPTPWYPTAADGPIPIDATFDDSGTGLWVLAMNDDRSVDLVHVTAPGAGSVVATLALTRPMPEPPVDPTSVPRFAGLSADDRVIAIEDGDQTLLVNTETAVQHDVSGSFAGWEAGGTYPAGS